MANPTTVMGWLQTLEEPYRSQAIANCDNPNEEASSQIDAIGKAFSWTSSREKYDYWCDYYYQLKDKEEQASDAETPYQVSEVWEVAPNGKVLVDVIELAEWKRKAEAYDRIEAVVKGGKQ